MKSSKRRPPAFTDAGPSASGTPVQLQIRRIIFEKFNDTEARFNNDQILEEMRRGGGVGADCTVDDLEPFFEGVCKEGLVRNIAQNLTTIWFKLFERMEEIRCGSCGLAVHMGGAEPRVCPNPGCQKPI